MMNGGDGTQSMNDCSLSATLQDHCLLYLVTHLTELSPESLALLPKHLRLALLKSVAPIHLCWLEQTRVANGIDTEPIWCTFSEVPFHRNSWAAIYPDQSDSDYSLRELYTRFIFSIFQNLAQKSYNSQRAKVALFGLFQVHLPAGVYLLLQNHHTSLKGPALVSNVYSDQELRDFSTEYYLAETHNSWEHSSIVETLMKYNAMPKKLCISVSSQLALNAEPMDLLLRALSKASFQSLSVSITGMNKDHDKIVTMIVDTILKQENITLEHLTLELANSQVLQSLSNYFTSPNGYNGLKGIAFSIARVNPWPEGKSDVQLLSSIVQHQSSLEQFTLNCNEDWLYTKKGVDIPSDIAPLFDQPHFKELHLDADVEMPQDIVCSLIVSLLRSKSQVTQKLHLRGVVVTDESIVPDTFADPLQEVWKGGNDNSEWDTGEKVQQAIEERMREQASVYNKLKHYSKDSHLFGEHLIRMVTMAIKTKSLEKVGTYIESDYYERALNCRPVKFPKINGNPFATILLDEKEEPAKQECTDNHVTKDDAKNGEPSEAMNTVCSDKQLDVLPIKISPFDEPRDGVDSENEEEVTPMRPQKIFVLEKVEFSELFLQWLCNQSHGICLLGLEVEVTKSEQNPKSLYDFFKQSRVMKMDRLYCSFNMYEDVTV